METGEVTSLEPMSAEGVARYAGRRFLAVAASMFLPGLGHVLMGASRRGLFWLCVAAASEAACMVCIAVPHWFWKLVVFGPVLCAISIASWIDAFGQPRRSGRTGGRAAQRFVAGFALLAATIAVGPRILLANWVINNVARAFVIQGRSMEPTLKANDRFIAHLGMPLRRWDLVVIDGKPGDPYPAPFVKRIVGLPGERVEVYGGGVYINGKAVEPPADFPPIDDRRIQVANGAQGRPVRLGAGEYYLLGDNSANSADSRIWRDSFSGAQPGAVPASHIMGRVTVVYWPVSRWRMFE